MEKPYMKELTCIRSTFKLLFLFNFFLQIPVFIPKIKRMNPEYDIQIVTGTFFFLTLYFSSQRLCRVCVM